MRLLPAGGLAGVVTLGGCSGAGEPAEEAAGRRDAGLESGRLAGDQVTVGSREPYARSSYAERTGSLSESSRAVDDGEVSEADGKGEVTLVWSWDVEGAE